MNKIGVRAAPHQGHARAGASYGVHQGQASRAVGTKGALEACRAGGEQGEGSERSTRALVGQAVYEHLVE